MRAVYLCALLGLLCVGVQGLSFSFKSDPSVIIPSHHHKQFDKLKALSPLDLSSNERALWLQAAFAEKLHQEKTPHIDKCIICEVVVQLIQWAVNSNLTESVMEDIATMYCEYKDLYGGFPDVCYGMIKEDGPILVYVLSKKYLDPKTVCTQLNLCSSTKTIPVPQGWDGESVLNLKPEVPSRPSKPRNVGSFAHLSDIHFDALYTVGTDANCGKPECCRVANGVPADPSDMALPYGDLRNCDTSPALLESTVAFIQSLPAVDFVVWTGDEPPHDVWEQSRSENLNASALVTDAMLRAFGNSPVFPSIGNHESFPVNQFEGPGADNWLYDSLAQDWSIWLDQQAQDTLRYGGFYAALVPGTKLRVISVNSNYGNSGNFWLLLESGDVAGQLQWLNSTLASCRANGERAYIIGHIPWGSTVNAYATLVHAIIEEYQDVIAGQFYGHTHHDQFQMFRDNATNSIPISMSFICPSITPYGYVLPSFRIYQFDRDTFEVLDYTEYTLNITEANIAGNATWYVEYQLKSEYGMAGASPADFQQLITRMNTDDALFYKYRFHSSRLPPDACDASCKKSILCDAASATTTLYRQCMSTANSVLPEFQATRSPAHHGHAETPIAAIA